MPSTVGKREFSREAGGRGRPSLLESSYKEHLQIDRGHGAHSLAPGRLALPEKELAPDRLLRGGTDFVCQPQQFHGTKLNPASWHHGCLSKTGDYKGKKWSAGDGKNPRAPAASAMGTNPEASSPWRPNTGKCKLWQPGEIYPFTCLSFFLSLGLPGDKNY